MFRQDLCYDREGIRQIEHKALQRLSAYDLMERAAKAIYSQVRRLKLNKPILIFCGSGNNGGDGYIFASIAHAVGLKVRVFSLFNSAHLKGPAKIAYDKCLKSGVEIVPFASTSCIDKDCYVIDAILGIGISKPISGLIEIAIKAINASQNCVISVDVPSGLDPDTGLPLGEAIKAHQTVTFLGHKIGLLTGYGKDYAGKVTCDNLSLEDDCYQGVVPNAKILFWEDLKLALKPRLWSSHKGDYGHVLIIGGDEGMMGAVHLAGNAALHVGAGKVTIASHPNHASLLSLNRPELIYFSLQDSSLLKKISIETVPVIGPGLSLSNWSQQLFTLLSEERLMVVDGGGLRGLAQKNIKNPNWILTPHPGEAADLLQTDSMSIQKNRLKAAHELQAKYGGIIVLKGSGTIIVSPTSNHALICVQGNPGMASSGMGDVLSGVIGGLLAQGFEPLLATQMGVVLHALAGDLAAGLAPRGLLASDLLPFLRQLINP